MFVDLEASKIAVWAGFPFTGDDGASVSLGSVLMIPMVDNQHTTTWNWREAWNKRRRSDGMQGKKEDGERDGS